jgi:hypothetical protein
LREKKLYAGQAGIYADMTRTREISPTGIAVSVLHTGQHYADDVDDDGIIYHYPTTGRERLPVFVGSRQEIDLSMDDFENWYNQHPFGKDVE